MTLAKNLKTLKELSGLKKGWHGKEGDKIPTRVINVSRKILKLLGDYQQYLYPTLNDSLRMEFDGPDVNYYFEIEIQKYQIKIFKIVKGQVYYKDVKRKQILPQVKDFFNEFQRKEKI